MGLENVAGKATIYRRLSAAFLHFHFSVLLLLLCEPKQSNAFMCHLVISKCEVVTIYRDQLPNWSDPTQASGCLYEQLADPSINRHTSYPDLVHAGCGPMDHRMIWVAIENERRSSSRFR
jgi:hypothetical protein